MLKIPLGDHNGTYVTALATNIIALATNIVAPATNIVAPLGLQILLPPLATNIAAPLGLLGRNRVLQCSTCFKAFTLA